MRMSEIFCNINNKHNNNSDNRCRTNGGKNRHDTTYDLYPHFSLILLTHM